MAETVEPKIREANELHLPFLSIVFGIRSFGFSKARLFSICFNGLRQNKTMHFRQHGHLHRLPVMQRTAQQIIGREGETATFLSRCPLNFSGLGGGFAPRQLNRSTFLGKSKLCEIVTRKYHSPKEYQDAAKSPETPSSELAFLAKSEYNFVRLAVAQNPNVTAEILTSLVPDNLDSWNEQEIARALTQNEKTSLETLSLLAEKLISVLDSGRDNDLGLEAGIYLCNNPNTPFEAIEKIMASEKASTLFRRKVASKSQRQDVLELLLTDRSEAVRRRAANNLESLRQSATS